jgi:hypothetical protein
MKIEMKWKKLKERKNTVTYARQIGNLYQSVELEKELIEVIRNGKITSSIHER